MASFAKLGWHSIDPACKRVGSSLCREQITKTMLLYPDGEYDPAARDLAKRLPLAAYEHVCVYLGSINNGFNRWSIGLVQRWVGHQEPVASPHWTLTDLIEQAVNLAGNPGVISIDGAMHRCDVMANLLGQVPASWEAHATCVEIPTVVAALEQAQVFLHDASGSFDRWFVARGCTYQTSEYLGCVGAVLGDM